VDEHGLILVILSDDMVDVWLDVWIKRLVRLMECGFSVMLN